MLAGAFVHSAPLVMAAFLASLVEFTEALTIVLAVGTTRGWRSAFTGTAFGFLFLTVLVVVFGSRLQSIPLHTIQLVIGSLLLLFGLRWLRKAILRTAGVIALHDEDLEFAKESSVLKSSLKSSLKSDLKSGPSFKQFYLGDSVAVLTAFKAVVLEGVEVVFIVIAMSGTASSVWPAASGAIAALFFVVILGFIVHKPLSRIPENQLKFTVGALLTTFGCFWVGESFGYPWPGEDLSLLGLFAIIILFSLLGAKFARHEWAKSKIESRPGEFSL